MHTQRNNPVAFAISGKAHCKSKSDKTQVLNFSPQILFEIFSVKNV